MFSSFSSFYQVNSFVVFELKLLIIPTRAVFIDGMPRGVFLLKGIQISERHLDTNKEILGYRKL